MRKHLLFFFSLIAFTICQPIVSQNNANSPYTRFGYGDISDNLAGAQRAMGGISLGVRSNSVINTANPASYSSVDSMTFMFDVGVSALGSMFSDNAGKRTTFNANLEYLTLQFPIWKYLGFSAGILPYSFVGYNFSESDSINENAHYSKSYSGTGGITEVYAGLSAEFFRHISLGINAYYMFGEINNTRTLTYTEGFNSTSMESSLQVSDLRLRYGAQFYYTFANKHNLTLGFIFENKSKLNGTFQQIETVTSDTIYNSDGGFDLPMIYGGGLTYTFDNRLMIGMDYMTQAWSQARYFGVTDSLRNRTKISIGAEYRHNPMGKRYIDRMAFRAGFNLSDSYLKSIDTKDFGISFGIGLPLRNSNTLINTSFEYGKRGSTNLMREDYFKFTLNASISETWFFKRKL